MRKYFILISLAAIFGLATPAFADSYCNGPGNDDCDVYNNTNDNSTTNNDYTYDDSNTANGYGVGYGEGGDANASSGAFAGAEGGDATSTLGRNNDFGGDGGDGGDSYAGSYAGSYTDNYNTAYSGAYGSNEQDQTQGQAQGQTQEASSDQDQLQAQSASSDQSQSQSNSAVGSGNETNVDARDQSTTVYKARKIPVNSAAPVFAGNCAQGVSGQFSGFGGSIGSGNPVCDFVAVAGAYAAAGDLESAHRVLEMAEEAAKRRDIFSAMRSLLTLGLL